MIQLNTNMSKHWRFRLLNSAKPEIIVSRFGLGSLPSRRNWFIRLWRKLLGKTEDKAETLSKGKPINFRRYEPLGIPPPKGAIRTKTGLFYTEETINVTKES